MDALRVLLVDDHTLFRHGMKSLLDACPNVEVVGSAADGYEALSLTRQTQPDVILMDIEMPRCNGLEATRLIKGEFPQVVVVILTVVEDDETVFEAIKCGAQGYLLKTLEAYQLYDLLEGLRRGDAPLSGAIAAKILREFTHPKPQGDDQPVVEALTERERDVLELIVEGKTNKEIGDALYVTENTVKNYLSNILAKLHLQNRIQAAVYAVTQGLVDAPQRG
ncbi:MAG: response regulator transcription factor [Anaerolineae bacterium]|nr:response regulator transcription factor [Anaerolineae bacterium]